MHSEPSVPARKNHFSVVRVAAVLAVLAIAPAVLVARKHQDLVVSCSLGIETPQQALSSCDTLLRLVVWTPERRSLMYRNKMRVHMIQHDWGAALREVDLAIAEQPENFVSWSWKMKVLQQAGDETGMVQVGLDAFQGPAKAWKDLPTKYKQLFALKLYEVLDERVAGSVRTEDFGAGLKFWDTVRIVRNSSRYPKTHSAFLDWTTEFRDNLASEPKDQEALRTFFEACRYLGPDCPPLFPEQRKNYPEMSCDTAVLELDRLFPNYANATLSHRGYETLQEFFQNGGRQAAISASSIYFVEVMEFADRNDAEFAERVIVTDRLFECFSNGELYYLVPDIEPEDKRMANDVLYHPELRRNLLDLAHAALN